MPYTPIQLDESEVPESIRYFVGYRVEPYLCDVRAMLQAPSGPTEPQLNLSIATVLCTVIGGLGRIFYNEIVGDGDSFQKVAQRYPMTDEPADAIRDGSLFAAELYDAYRCELVHSLGLHMDRPDRNSRWSITNVEERYVVARWHGLPRSEADLAALDAATGRPSGLPATLSRMQDKVRLDADALYCGVRRLVRILATDESRHAIAVPVLQSWFDALRTPARETSATQSSTDPTFYSTGHVTDATLGAISEVSSFWGKVKDEKPGS